MQERLQRARPLGIDLVQPMHRLVQSATAFDLPAHTIEVGHLPWADPGRQVGEEETIALGRVDPHETEMEWALVSPAGTSASMARPSRTRISASRRASRSVPGKHSWVTCPRARESTVGFQLSFRRITKRTSWALQAPEAFKTGIATIGQETATSPGLVNGARPAVMLPSGAEMVAHRRPAADRDHLMDLARSA